MTKRASRKQIMLGMVIALILLLGFAGFFTNTRVTEEVAPVYTGAADEVRALKQGEPFTLEFTSPADQINKATIRIAFLNGKPESGHVGFRLHEKGGGEPIEVAVDISEARSNGPLAASFENIARSKGKVYVLELVTTDIPDETPVTLMGEDAVPFLSLGYTVRHYPTIFLVILCVLAICLAPGLFVGTSKEVRP